ncbi:MAG: hypothetical protein KGJ78_09505 [Alphaproteobacteria bacterium]|nr:hypothetical protein [Alphaproteobacteria bacterium]
MTIPSNGAFTIGDRLSPPGESALQASANRPNAMLCAKPDCAGCGVALAARTVIDAAIRVSRRLTVVTVTDCLKPAPNPASRAVTFKSATAVKAAEGAAPILVHTDEASDGLEALAGRDMLLVCYDKTTGERPQLFQEIIAAPGLRYGATATIADIRDLESKIAKAMALTGPRLVVVLAPCPLDCGSQPQDTVRLARLAVESGLFPVLEAENGRITRSRRIRRRLPVRDVLKLQARFADVLKVDGDPRLAALQAAANDHIRAFNLLRRDGEV